MRNMPELNAAACWCWKPTSMLSFASWTYQMSEENTRKYLFGVCCWRHPSEIYWARHVLHAVYMWKLWCVPGGKWRWCVLEYQWQFVMIYYFYLAQPWWIPKCSTLGHCWQVFGSILHGIPDTVFLFLPIHYSLNVHEFWGPNRSLLLSVPPNFPITLWYLFQFVISEHRHVMLLRYSRSPVQLGWKPMCQKGGEGEIYQRSLPSLPTLLSLEEWIIGQTTMWLSRK